MLIFLADEESLQRQSSKGSTKSSGSSMQGTSSPLVDSLLKSLAKDQQPLEPRNQATVATTEKEVEPMKTSLTVETIVNHVQLVPNNQVAGTSTLPPRTPIPLESLKCNILKAKSLEQGKNSNLVSITSTDTPGVIAKKNQHPDAATIVSVVNIMKLASLHHSITVLCSALTIYIFTCPSYVRLSYVLLRFFIAYILKLCIFISVFHIDLSKIAG